MRVELAGDDDEVTLGRDIDAVRAAGFGGYMQQSFCQGGLEGDDGEVLDHLDLAGLVDLLGFVPVDDVQEVRGVHACARFEGGLLVLDATGRLLGIDRVHEEVAVACELARVGEVLPVGGELDGKRLGGVDASAVAVELPEGHRALVFLFVLTDGRVVAAPRNGVLAALDDVLGVGCDECAAVVAERERVLDDLLGFPVAQIDDTDASVDLVVDEEPLPVIVPVGFREGRVVGVAPEVGLALGEAGFEDFVADAETPALPGLGGEDGDGAEQAHAGETDRKDLSGVPAGGEHDILVLVA